MPDFGILSLTDELASASPFVARGDVISILLFVHICLKYILLAGPLDASPGMYSHLSVRRCGTLLEPQWAFKRTTVHLPILRQDGFPVKTFPF